MKIRTDPARTGNLPNTGATTRPRSLFATGARRFSIFAACVAVTACASATTARPRVRPATGQSVAVGRQTRSRWPDPANYNAIVVAVKVRNQALHLKVWDQKAYAAQLALRTLATLVGSMLPEQVRSLRGPHLRRAGRSKPGIPRRELAPDVHCGRTRPQRLITMLGPADRAHRPQADAGTNQHTPGPDRLGLPDSVN